MIWPVEVHGFAAFEGKERRADNKGSISQIDNWLDQNI